MRIPARNTRINTVVVYAFVIVWAICFVYIGIPEILEELGGSIGLYFLLPFIVFLNLKYKDFGKLIWVILLTLTSLIGVNYLYSYFLSHYHDFRLLTRVYVISTPFCFICLGYVLTPQNFLLLEKRNFERKEDIEAISYFSALLVGALTTPIFTFIPIVLHLRDLRNINSLGYQIALGGLIIGGLIFIFEASILLPFN